MRHNPIKCIFGLRSGKFLGFMISQRGIKANPEKIQAILNMLPPRSHKEVLKLTSCLAALRRFVSKLAEHCLPFFNILKGTQSSRNFNWT